MLNVDNVIQDYKNAVATLTQQAQGLRSVVTGSDIKWVDYNNEVIRLNNKVKELYTAEYKLEIEKYNTIVTDNLDPENLTVVEMMKNVTEFDNVITASFTFVKGMAAKKVDAFVSSFTADEEQNIKNIVKKAYDYKNLKKDFLKASLIKMIDGLPQLSEPENVVLEGTVLTWDPVPEAEEYEITWDEVIPIAGASAINSIITSDLEVDLAVEMLKQGATAGNYIIKVFALGKPGETATSTPSITIPFTLLVGYESITIVNVTPVISDGGNTLTNVGKYTIDSFTDSTSEYIANIKVTDSLNTFISTISGQDDAKWIGILITTNTDITELAMKTSTMTSFINLETKDIEDSIEAGAVGTNTFVWWLKSENIDDGEIIELKKQNDSKTLSLTITFTPYIEEIIPEESENWIVHTFNTFPETWISSPETILSDTNTEIENDIVLTSSDLDILETNNPNFAILTRYVEIENKIGGLNNDADFDEVNMTINGELLVDSGDLSAVIIDGGDIDSDDDGWAYIDGSNTRFKNIIAFANKIEDKWELIDGRSEAIIEYIFRKDGEIVAIADGGTIPQIIINNE